MSSFHLGDHSHRRYNPLTDEWVQVSPHRAKRPWQGQVEKHIQTERPEHDPDCYLCAGNTRANGKTNPDYKDTFSFVNDFSAIPENTPDGAFSEGEFFKAKSEKGICKVICFSPRHDLTIPEMPLVSIEKVVTLWTEEYEALAAQPHINYVQIFENKGAIMGCSNPHPHGQIWAQQSIPDEPTKKSRQFRKYYEQHQSVLLVDYIQQELQKKERILFENDHFVTLIPFWAIWPFEAMIVPKRAISQLTQFTQEEQRSFAEAYKKLTICYDNLFETSFPYSAGIHQAPTDGRSYPEWQLHMVFYPPLLRSATVKKFMVGYEMLANPQRDITPEQAAEMLRDVAGVHYKMR
ncbi:UDP-glucose--hexose-1-phosphate uridylyltransferase [Flavobacteriaceae bacterium M23B6Z8]